MVEKGVHAVPTLRNRVVIFEMGEGLSIYDNSKEIGFILCSSLSD